MSRLTRDAAVLFCALALGLVGCSRDHETMKRKYLQSGDKYVAQKHYAEAVVEYRNAVNADPKSGEARRKLAGAYMRAGNPRAAFGEYMRAADLLPGNIEAQLEAANADISHDFPPFGQVPDPDAVA